MTSNLAKRIGFAVVAIPVALLVVWLGGWVLAALVSVIAVLGVNEIFALASKHAIQPLRITGSTLAAVTPLLAYASITDPNVAIWIGAWWPYLGAMIVLALLAAVLVARSPAERPLPAISITLFGIGYAAALPSFLLGIRHGNWPGQSWSGAALVFFPLVVTWVCDSTAMFGGSKIGGPKLAPTVSPGKTRSGGVSGIIGGLAVAPVFVYLVFPAAGIAMSLAAALGLALILSVIGQAGDLAESLFKREAGVKDSSNLIPGHGGVLDRFDSLYVVIPVAAIGYRLLGLA